MDDWATANIRQREHFAAICEAERRAADCTCTAGVVCRQNAACPRLTARKARQQDEARRLHSTEAA